MYEVRYTAEARSAIQALRLKEKSQVENAIGRLIQDPRIGKRLTHELSDYHSYRTGDYRILYKIYHKEIRIIVFTVGNRKSVYEVFKRKFS